MPLRFPVILGPDVAGEVVETGTNVTTLKPGQCVMGLVNQSYAELLTAASDILTLIPARPVRDCIRRCSTTRPEAIPTGGPTLSRLPEMPVPPVLLRSPPQM